MKRFWILVVIPFLLTNCREPGNDLSSMIETDKAFSRMCVEKGRNAAFIYYADDSVVKMRDGAFPVIGKDEMAKIYRSKPDTGFTMKWKPVRAEAGKSGDLGYTFGEWELYLKARDTTLYGNYVTLWKKQKDGTWKYILDTGTSTPKPGQ